MRPRSLSPAPACLACTHPLATGTRGQIRGGLLWLTSLCPRCAHTTTYIGRAMLLRPSDW